MGKCQQTAFTIGASLANFVVKHPGLESLLSNQPTDCLSILVNAIARRRIISFSEANVSSHVYKYDFQFIIYLENIDLKYYNNLEYILDILWSNPTLVQVQRT